jgi:predicted DNA-binding helix-hairpin-helix protein
MSDLQQKLELLAPAARFDACGTFAQRGRRYSPAASKAAWEQGGIAADSDGDGRGRTVFRVLMSSRCQWNCAYCPLRSGNDTPRAALEPEELARLFLPRYEAGAVGGLFLSTGVDGGLHSSLNKMLDAVELLAAGLGAGVATSGQAAIWPRHPIRSWRGRRRRP